MHLGIRGQYFVNLPKYKTNQVDLTTRGKTSIRNTDTKYVIQNVILENYFMLPLLYSLKSDLIRALRYHFVLCARGGKTSIPVLVRYKIEQDFIRLTRTQKKSHNVRRQSKNQYVFKMNRYFIRGTLGRFLLKTTSKQTKQSKTKQNKKQRKTKQKDVNWTRGTRSNKCLIIIRNITNKHKKRIFFYCWQVFSFCLTFDPHSIFNFWIDISYTCPSDKYLLILKIFLECTVWPT